MVEFKIYQGESRRVSDNVFLGKVTIPVPPKRAGEVVVNCRFTYDINGILEVDLHVLATGRREALTIVDDSTAMSPSELEERRRVLAKLKIHPRDDDANRAVIARLHRCFEQTLGESREMVGQWISQFMAILDTQNPRDIAAARVRVTTALDNFEGESLL
jgi:molecular chaperone HscC